MNTDLDGYYKNMGEKLVIYYKAGNEGFEEWWSGSWVLKTKPVGKVGEIPKGPTG